MESTSAVYAKHTIASTLSAGKEYTLTGWVYDPDGSVETPSFYINGSGEGSYVLTDEVNITTVQGQWAQFSYKFTPEKDLIDLTIQTYCDERKWRHCH